MSKIDSQNQIPVSKKTLSTILERYNILNFSYKHIDEGIENTTVLITTPEKKYVLRIYCRLKKTNQMIKTELAFQELLQERNLPVPYIYPNSDGEKLTIIELNGVAWQIILMHYMGKTDFKQFTPELLTDMAKTQAEMHQLGIAFAKKQSTHEKIRTELKETLSLGRTLPTDNKEIIAFLNRARAYYLPLNKELPYGYNHLDYDTHGNILVKNGKISAILDFDDLAYSPSVMCLAYTLWNVLFIINDFQQISLYLKVYQTIRKLTKEELAILPKIMLFRNYAIGAIELSIRKTTKNIYRIMQLEEAINKMQFLN